MTESGPEHIHWFRNTAPYINAHRGRTFVLLIPGEAIQHGNFSSLIHDIALLHSLGVRLVLAVGARPQIDARLERSGIETPFHDRVRITCVAAMEQVKDAVGALRAEFEARLSTGLPNSPMQGARIRICSGNFLIARPLGVVEGVDFQYTGSVRRVEAAAIRDQLDNGSVVMLTPLGCSPTGEMFNVAMEEVAQHCAGALGADKLILLGSEAGIMDKTDALVRQIATADIQDLDVGDAEQQRLLETARRACARGVQRCHIVSYRSDTALLEELFTHDGSGTLVAQGDFERFRGAGIDDVGGILELLAPLEQQGVLVKRSRELLENEIRNFRVLERDGRIIACAALYPFAEFDCGEIACIVTHPDYRGAHRGQKLLRELEQEARATGLAQVFVLTTQTAHWFIEQGFVASSRESLPAPRQLLYNLQRNSKVFFKRL